MKIKLTRIVLFLCIGITSYAQSKTQHEWYLSLLPKIKNEVPPMLRTSWGQNAPYHNQCPLAPQKSVHCKTGCVATAMAQVMKYYAYPARGTGSISYQYKGDDNQQYTVTADFGQSVYDWQNMKDSYSPIKNATQQQKEAVAKLMADCGAAVKMQYGQYDSGAFDMDIPNAMKTYFGYDPSISYLSSFDEPTDSLWFTTLYQQLSDGMPVIYGGSTESYLLHSFVVDGYNSEGKFHVVYGLGGNDGYVDIRDIRFKYGQSMIYNIRPPKTTGIEHPLQPAREATEQARFLLDGTRIATPQRGLNIVKMSDGSVKKIVVR